MPISPVAVARVDAAVRREMRETRIAGLAIGVERDGVTVLVRGYGYAGRGQGRRVDARTIFPIGSLTKSFTAALTRAATRPDDALARYLPDYPRSQEITIDQLLRETAGIPEYAGEAFDRSSREPVAPERFVARLAAMPPAGAPGERFAYSNGSYLLAAYACARALAEPYASALQSRVLRPLGLARTHVANAFVPEADRATGDAPAGSATLGFGSADLESDVPDMLAWYAALEAGARVPAPRYLPPYADGFYDGALFGRPALTASGYVAGFSSYAALLPGSRASVVVLANADAVDLGPLAQSALAVALGIAEAAPAGTR